MDIPSFVPSFSVVLAIALPGCRGESAGGCGGVCVRSAEPCHVGRVDCSSGAAVCVDTSEPAAAGTGCGVNRFCTAAGDCGDCTQNAVCKDGIAPCHAGAIACDTGAAVCNDAGDLPDGTSCTSGATSGYCQAGVCTACVAPGADCGGGGHCTADGRCMLTVAGSAEITLWQEDGSSTDVGNCFGQQAEVFTANDAGGYTLLAPTVGVCTATSYAFTIPEPVPAGAYLLHFSGTPAYGNFYVETTRPTVDFGRDQASRPDSNIVAGSSTKVTFDSSGLDPWTPGSDTLDIVCGNVGLSLAVAGSASGLTDLSAGATGGTSVVDWQGHPLIDPVKGNAVWLVQMSTMPTGVPAKSYLAATRARALSGFQVEDGTPTTAAAALSAVTMSGSVALTWATSRFEALAVEANPGYAAGAHYLSVDAVEAPPNAWKYVPASARVELLALTAQPGQADLPLGTLAYGRFLGSPWREVLSTKFDMHAEHTAPGAASAATSYIGIYQQDPLPLAPGTVVTPRLGPPLRPLVAGRDATVPQSSVTTTPEISWLAPSVGVPDVYAIAIHELARGTDGESSDDATVASFLTPSMRILLPPGVLVSGHTYYAVIATLRTPDVAYDRAPLRQGISSVRAETGTAIFTP